MTRDGLLVARLTLPSLLDALALMDAGAASARVDAACRAAGRPGPLESLRRDGAQVWLERLEAVAVATRRPPRFHVPARLRVIAADPGALDTDVLAIDAPPSAPDTGAFVERIELATINEAYRMVGDDVSDPPMLDATLRAAGWPRGPFEMAGDLGLRRLVDRLRALSAANDPSVRDRFQVAPALWQVATI